MRGCMWTQIVYEEKTDRVHPHGPHFPFQLVSLSSTHWIAQEALLNMIDAIDADMHARPADAEITTLALLLLDSAPQHIAAEFRSIMRDTRPHIKLCYVQRNFTGYTQPLDRAYMRAFKNSIRQRGGQTLRRVLLGSRVQLRTLSIWTPAHRSAPTAAALIRAHCRTERRQLRNIEPLAGASSIGTRWSNVSFSQRQNAFWRRENCFHEAQPRSLARQMPRPKPPTTSQRRT